MTRHSRTLPLSILLLGLLGAGSAVAAMYKWTDANGDVHYSQSPPDNGNAQEVAPPPPAPISSEEAHKQLEKSKQVLTPPKKASDSDIPDRAALEERYKKNCANARKNLELYQHFRRFTNDKGEVSVLTDEQRATRIKQTQDQIKRFCNQ